MKYNIELGLHKYDLRGQHDLDYMTMHHHYIQTYEARHDHLAKVKATSTSFRSNHPYMVWYHSITNLFATPYGSSSKIVVVTMSLYLLFHFLLI